MSALMRLHGEIRSVETQKKEGKIWGRLVTVLSEVGHRLGDGVKVVIFDSDSDVVAEPRQTVDWLVAVEASRFGLNVRFIGLTDTEMTLAEFDSEVRSETSQAFGI